ncbi:ATP binding [Entomophthora muscae]|uniref:ATP binding n=1 Tax=Entomophthora muscae TaxID=34485 RepID=A0ACC2T8V8_9FUNG|nr:ATP binding [Entomophthora muscae]
MSPEVVKHSLYTFKADIWGLGCLVIEMLTGDHPFPHLNQMQAIFRIGSSYSPDIPEGISHVCRNFIELSLKIDYNTRPSTKELLLHKLVSKRKDPSLESN